MMVVLVAPFPQCLEYEIQKNLKTAISGWHTQSTEMGKMESYVYKGYQKQDVEILNLNWLLHTHMHS